MQEQEQEKSAWVPKELHDAVNHVSAIGRNVVASVGVLTSRNPGCTGLFGANMKWVSYNNNVPIDSNNRDSRVKWTTYTEPRGIPADTNEMVLSVKLDFDYIIQKKQRKIMNLIKQANLVNVDPHFHVSIESINKQVPVYPRKKQGVNALLKAHRKFNPKFEDNDLLITERDYEEDWDEDYVYFSKKLIKDECYLKDFLSEQRMEPVNGEYTHSVVNLRGTVDFVLKNDELGKLLTQIYDIISDKNT
jgi:hypothetical protein